jgi:hypothetical protein
VSFSIRFLPHTADGSELGNAAWFGEIELGEEIEVFTSVIGFWSPHDYMRQWRQGLDRALSGRHSCLITSLHDPSLVEVLHWWLLYPQGESIALQNALLILRDLPTAFTTSDPYSAIPPYRTHSEEGLPISEWKVSRSDIMSFLSPEV